MSLTNSMTALRWRRIFFEGIVVAGSEEEEADDGDGRNGPSVSRQDAAAGDEGDDRGAHGIEGGPERLPCAGAVGEQVD